MLCVVVSCLAFAVSVMERCLVDLADAQGGKGGNRGVLPPRDERGVFVLCTFPPVEVPIPTSPKLPLLYITRTLALWPRPGHLMVGLGRPRCQCCWLAVYEVLLLVLGILIWPPLRSTRQDAMATHRATLQPDSIDPL